MKHNRFSWLLLITFIIKCLLACVAELNNDEVYYWTYAQQLQWSYFDHPPGIALLLKFFTGNLSFQDAFFLRLGPIICATISTWLIFRIGKSIKDEMTGWIAAILFTASPYCSIIAGFLVIPDAPMLTYWLWSVWLMINICGPTKSRRKTNTQLLLLGITIGACILCKVHGIFLWFGFGSYIILFRRKLLSNSFLYYAVFISIIMAVPIFYWNMSNNFISYTYHSGRVSFFSGFQPDSFLREILGEVLYNNPISFVLIISSLIAIIKGFSYLPLFARHLLLFLAMPLIIVTIIISLFRDTLPHWSGPAYTTLIPLTAAWLRSKQKDIQAGFVPRAAKWSLIFTCTLLVIAVMAVWWCPWRMGKSDWQQLGSGDVTLDMNGWKKFGAQFDSLYRSDIKNGTMSSNSFAVADYWFPAAHIDYYAASKAHIPFVAIGSLTAIHHYAWLNTKRPFLQEGDDAYFITVSNFFNNPSPLLTNQFENTLPPISITQYRNGMAVRNFFIFRLKHYKGGIPSSGILRN